MFKAFLAAILFLLLTSSASAEPVSAAIAAISSWWAAASAVVKIGVMLAINVGTGLLEQYRARKAAQKNADNQPRGVTLSVQVGDTLPRSFILGTRATAGYRKYIGVWGEVDKTPNAFLVDVRELSCLPSHAGPTGLQAMRVADLDVTIRWNEPHPDGRGYPVDEYSSDNEYYLWVKFLDGSQIAADPYLLSKFGGHADRPYKSTMIGRGCQAVIITMRRHEEMFRSGIPEMLFVPSPMRLYDLRKDTTAGGSGAHRWADPSTWEPSDNLPLMAYNVARGIYYDGRWVHGGRNFATHRLPVSSWMAAINEADRDMGGGRRQFRGGLEVRVSEPGLSVLEKLRVGCAGRYAEIGGSLKMLVGAPAAAVWTMTDETVVVTRDQDFDPFPSSKKAVNTIRATYPEPAIGWRDKEAPQRSSAELLARDGGEELAVDVDLEAVDDAAQVQCISATMIEEAQRWRTHRQVLPPSARVLEPNDVIAVSSIRNSYSNKKFIISRIRRLTGCLIEVTYQELEPSDYDPPEIILPPVTGPTGPIPVPTQPMTGWRATPDYIGDADGNARRPSILVGCAADLDDVVRIWVQVRLKASGALVFDSDATPYAAPYEWTLSGDWLLPDTEYEVSGELVPYSKRPTERSGWITVLTYDVRLSVDDLTQQVREALEQLRDWIDDDTIDGLVQQTEELAEQLGEEQSARVDGAIEASDRYRSLVDEITAIRDRAMDSDIADYRAREEIKRSLTVSIEDYAASFNERIAVAASDIAAVAQRTTTLEASTLSLGAQITTVDTARIEGDEALARSIDQIVAGNINQFDQAVDWYFDDSVEGWGGNGAPTATGGWLRPADHATLPYVISPDALGVSGARYGQVRGRIRRTGTPVWRGQLWWQTVTDAAWDAARRVTIAEPTWDVDGNALFTFSAAWAGATITRIRLDLTEAQAAGSAVEIDWIAIGRPSPGASSAALAAEQEARAAGDGANASDILALETRATDLESGVSGLASGVSALETEVSTLGDTVTATGNALDALALEVADKAELDVVNAMSAEITALGSGLLNQGSMVSAIRGSLLPSAMEGVDQDFANFLGERKGAVALAEASQALNTRIDLTNASLTIVAEAVTQVQAVIPSLATASGLNALTSRVTAAEGAITANSSAITAINTALPGKASTSSVTALEGRVSTAEGNITANALAISSISAALPDKADVSALNSLSATVSDLDGVVSAQATAITGLEANVGDISASGRVKMEVVAGPAGGTRIGWSGRAGTSGSHRTGGVYLDVPTNPVLPIQFVVEASRFAVIDGETKKVPFLVDGGKIYLTGDVYIERAIVGDLQVDTHNIKPGAVLVGGVGDGYSVTITSSFTVIASYVCQHGLGAPQVSVDWSVIGPGVAVEYRVRNATSGAALFTYSFAAMSADHWHCMAQDHPYTLDASSLYVLEVRTAQIGSYTHPFAIIRATANKVG